jgi:hypothetical protein
MAGRTDRNLRVSVARVAQALGFLPSDIPGNPPTWAFEHLARAAETDRGWNALAATIVERIQERERLKLWAT